MPTTLQQPTTEKEEEHPNAIYLSPSTQEHNIYACDETVSEEKAMWMIARQVKAMLEEDGYEVFICGEDDTVPDKVILGNKLKCGAYIAIHSNSSGENGNGEGTECFYNTKTPGSMELAEKVYNHVAEITPTSDRGLKDETERDLYELNNSITPCCFLEVEFHDKVKTSSWILKHIDDLAQAITEGLEAYMETAQYISRTDMTEPTLSEDDTYIDY
jgi:N-acetylmuramoyl-L-alanine amidase